MSAIAYITDSRLLEYHRLNASQAMNFWRPSDRTNFSKFKTGDLLFFLSKDRDHKRGNEKGIVGYGQVNKITIASVKQMWKKYRQENGYQTFEEFCVAIKKADKNHELPDRISSFYLENVCFFQAPLYLSELGIKISDKVESYIYLKQADTVIAILEYAKETLDIWSASKDVLSDIRKQQIVCALEAAYGKYGELNVTDNKLREAKHFLKKDKDHSFIADSKTMSYKLEEDLDIFVYNKGIDKRMILGQILLMQKEFKKLYTKDIKINYHFYIPDEELSTLLA